MLCMVADQEEIVEVVAVMEATVVDTMVVVLVMEVEGVLAVALLIMHHIVLCISCIALFNCDQLLHIWVDHGETKTKN
jgi:nitrate reductase gamma subunit